MVCSADVSTITATQQVGGLVMGKWVFISTPWGLRVLSPPPYIHLLGTAVSVDTDLALEPPYQCGMKRCVLLHALSYSTSWAKRIIFVARKAMLAHVAVLSSIARPK